MMFIAFSLLMTGAVSTFAQEIVKDSTKTTVTTTTKVALVKEEVKSTDLPQPVKDLCASFKTQGWDTAETAYTVKDEAKQTVYYLVSFKEISTGKSKSINIDANGKIVE